MTFLLQTDSAARIACTQRPPAASLSLNQPPREPMTDRVAQLDGLPETVAAGLADFIDAARKTLSADLVSAVLFGSAADGRLAPTSDVNVLLVLQGFSPGTFSALRDTLLQAEAAINLRGMFLPANQLPSPAPLLSPKFPAYP